MVYVHFVDNLPAVASVAPPPAAAPQENRISELLPELPAYLEESLSKLEEDKGLHFKARTFSAEEKEAFVRRYATNGGRFLEACAFIKAKAEVLYRHLEYDPQWARALRQAKLSMGEEISAVSYNHALTPEGFGDRRLQLRRFFPKVYAEQGNVPQVAVQINLDGGRT
jgi:hypothetical protein